MPSCIKIRSRLSVSMLCIKKGNCIPPSIKIDYTLRYVLGYDVSDGKFH